MPTQSGRERRRLDRSDDDRSVRVECMTTCGAGGETSQTAA